MGENLNNELMIVKIKMLLQLSAVVLHHHSYGQAAKSFKRQTVFIEEHTTNELSEKIRQGFTTVLIYSGGTEATGPHVALGKHNFRVRSYAQRIADSLGNTLIAPILPFAPARKMPVPIRAILHTLKLSLLNSLQFFPPSLE